MRILIFIISFSTLAQVGINTTLPDAMLDINGDLIVRNIEEHSNVNLLTLDATNKVTKRTDALLLIFEDEIIASRPYPADAPRMGYWQNQFIDIGFNDYNVTIPPNSTAIVKIYYSVPMGTTDGRYEVDAYMGVRVFRNGVDVIDDNRKESLPKAMITQGTQTTVQMFNVSNYYREEVSNPGASPLIITYMLRGYIEQAKSRQLAKYRFNMWSASGLNYNWGRAKMIVEVYVKN